MTLRERREGLGLSQTDMAARCGVSQGTISNAETGYRIPNADTLIRLSKGYRMSLRNLVVALEATRDAQREVA